MSLHIAAPERLLEKIITLPPEKITEVEDFVDFLRQQDSNRNLVQAAAKLSEEPLNTVWDNTDDAVYDQL
jgi:hypothetical protein